MAHTIQSKSQPFGGDPFICTPANETKKDLPYCLLNHAVSIFTTVHLPNDAFSDEEAETVVAVIEDVLNQHELGCLVDSLDERRRAVFDCDEYGGVSTGPSEWELMGVFSALSKQFPKAKFRIFLEDMENNDHFQLVLLFQDGRYEWDSSLTISPTLKAIDDKPLAQSLRFEATEAQMEKVYALLKAEGIQWK